MGLPVTAWAYDSTYQQGEFTTYGGKTYQATTGGVTASSGPGGPTGTGSGIIDGSVVWAYCDTVVPTEWDSSLTNITAPGGGYPAAGFAIDDVPTAALMNYLLRKIDVFLLWLVNLTSHVLTWTGLQTFSGGATGPMIPTSLQPTRATLGAHGVDMGNVYLVVDASAAPIWGAIGNVGAGGSGGTLLRIPATTAGGAAANLQPGTILIVADEAGTAGGGNVLGFASPATGGHTLDTRLLGHGINTAYGSVTLYYNGVTAGVEVWTILASEGFA